MAAYLGVRRRREKASSVAMRRLQSTSIANQDSAVVQAMAMDAAAFQCGERRVVPRALGKWRGSTIAGYLTHDDATYTANFRATHLQLDGLIVLLQGSVLDCADAQREHQARLRSTVHHKSRAVRMTLRARQAKDPPTLRFKVALCMYAMGQGGPIKVLADAGSVGEATLRRYLSLFSDAIMVHLKPQYMPGVPFDSQSLSAVQGQFASRRGIPNVTRARERPHLAQL